MAALSETLVVPIDLAALCVGDTDVNGSATNPYGTKDFARLDPDFSLLPYAQDGTAHNSGPYVSTQVLPDTFQRASNPLDVGIHLHWALPDAVSHGMQDDTGAIAFSPAPNRWLVARIATNSADPKAPDTCLKAWVIESDRLWDRDADLGPLAMAQNSRSLAVPIQPTPTEPSNKSFRTLGRAFDLDAWAEDPAADRADLTALGYGEDTYAAAYQLCPNVFGFWDTLDDLDPESYPPATTRISYLLMGWFAEARHDPLQRITYLPGATYADKIAKISDTYRWAFAPDADETVPTRTTYNALMTDIPWDRKTHYIDKRSPAPGSLEVAVGNTTPEALSALLAHKPDLRHYSNIELVLNALQLGLLSRLELPGGIKDIGEALHASAFASTSAGSIWVAEPAADVDPLATASINETGSLAPRSLAMLPPSVGDDLNALNAAQAAHDAFAREIWTLRSRIFADWYRYMQASYGTLPPDADPNLVTEIEDFLEKEVAALNDLERQQDTASDQVDALATALRQRLGSDYTLSRTDGPRFWNATDPTILFSGDEVKPPYRYKPVGALNADGDLICRVGPNLISAMTVPDNPLDLKVEAAALPALPVNPAIPVDAALSALIGEAFFLDPVQACVLAVAVAAQGGGNENPAIADFTAFVTVVRTAQAQLFSGQGPVVDVRFQGLPPTAVSFSKWAPPWIPIILQWQIDYYPNALGAFGPDFVIKNYTLDSDQIDLNYTGSIPANSDDLRSYEGTIVLTHNTEIDIRQQIEEYLKNFPDDDIDGELRKILDDMDVAMEAQALSGMNQGLLQLAQILQMEVSDPLAILKGLIFTRFTNETIRNAVKEHNTDTPLGNNAFSPLRTGGMKISRVRIIDAFGQPMDITDPSVIRAETMIPPQETQTLINLAPRMVQPTQLNFNWLAANNDAVEMNGHPATTPVFGWVLYNHLDRAMMIYDIQGKALGSFNELGPFWQGAPGNQQAYGKPIEEVFADANTHLRNFALGVASAGEPVKYLHDMLRAMDDSITFIAPGQSTPNDSLSVLIGRPLALVRARLDLTALGLPAMDQSFAAFHQALKSADPLDRDAGGAPHVKVPVQLGDVTDISDGLVGYFIDNGTPEVYQTFYSPVARPNAQSGVMRPAFDQITVVTDPETDPVFVSIMLDPQAPLHATTGMLPIKELTIPPSLISDDLASIAVTFLTTPILNSGIPTMPVPAESGYVWSWVTQRQGVGKWTIEGLRESDETSFLQQEIQEGWLKLQHQIESLITPLDAEDTDADA